MIGWLIVAVVGAVVWSGCSREQPAAPQRPAGQPDTAEALRRLVAVAEQCQPCHPKHYEEWRISMHAYAVEDPVFHALNELMLRGQQVVDDQFCMRCHTPFGSLFGETSPGVRKEQLSQLARQGVTCDVCHMMALPHPPGRSVVRFRLDGTRIGNVPDPLPNSFHRSEYEPRLSQSEACAPCHDVINPLGVLVERTYTEWRESTYPGRGITCQVCHMPWTPEPIVPNGPTRRRHSHLMPGVDVPLSDFPGREQMMEAVEYMLQNALRMLLTVPSELHRDSALRIRVVLANNITGHDIPTGSIFMRQMWLEVIVREATTGRVVYESGTLDSHGDLRTLHSLDVQNGRAPLDTSLVLFNGTALRNGKPAFFWEAHAVEFRTIPAFDTRTAVYTIAPPPGGWRRDRGLEVSVRLRFRALPPYLLRALGLEHLVERLPIFDMEWERREVRIR
ncbi:MAG: cytochrome c family protein [Candidatus Kapabacteria bacterium]|nr:cytochrome c family protein [Candidatus Kapabacteria bacterium]MDW8012525.1 multiheme c-type cytochrome [Bacteroidota bacterium]